MVDAELIARAAEGDSSASCRSSTDDGPPWSTPAGNHDDAEDIAQDVFIKVYRSLSRFRQDSQFTSWIYRMP
jgi:hypothetical protein